MQIGQILRELQRERDQLDAAIAALQGVHRLGSSRGSATPPANGRRHRRKMSAAARKRISQGMKRRWAERKKKQKVA